MSRSVEKVIRGKMSNNEFYSDAVFDDYNLNTQSGIETIIDVLNDELPVEYKSNKNLENLECLFEELKTEILRTDELNKKLIKKKLVKLSLRIDRIITERKNYIYNLEYEIPILESYIEQLDDILVELENKENSKYELLAMLMDEQQIDHLELAFNKYPGFVNIKNKDEESLFRVVINRYLDSALERDEESILFYSNLIALLQNQKSFNLSCSEKRECLEDIYKALNSVSYNKKKSKKYKDTIDWINHLLVIMEPDIQKRGMTSKDKNMQMQRLTEKYDVNTVFNERIIESVEQIKTPLEVQDYPDRRVVDDYLITIDGSEAIEIDDGISCRKLKNGNYLLGVHIASVLGYFDYNSEIVQEAINRVHSIYLPKNYQEKDNDFNKVIPILPFAFSADKASLLPGDYKLARSYYFEIDSLGKVVNRKFEKTIIRSSKKTTYDEINDVLENGTTNPSLSELVDNISTVADILEKKYNASILYQEVKKQKDNTTDLNVINKGAQKLVYYSMMQVGEEVAKFFHDNSYPFPYRTLEIDTQTSKQLESMVKNVTTTYGGRVYNKLYQLISGLYPKAQYARSGRHDGLDLDYYGHATSELRRAIDILVEHALEICYDKEPTEEELAELAIEVDRVIALVNNKTKKIEWFTNEYKILTKKRRH